MTIYLTQQHLNGIYQHGKSTYPEECCGIILGYIAHEEIWSDGVHTEKMAVELIPAENVWGQNNTEVFLEMTDKKATSNTEKSRRNRYAIAPQVMLQAQKNARDRTLNIIGIYHSHPDYPAIPSEFDRVYAWPEYSYIIVSISQPNPNQLPTPDTSIESNNQEKLESGIEIDTKNVHITNINLDSKLDIHSWCLDDNHQFQQEQIRLVQHGGNKATIYSSKKAYI